MYVPAALDLIEKRYLRDLWRTAAPDAAAEERIDLARFGPVQASIVVEEPEEPLVNVILGAGAKDAVKAGHLADAVEWVESHGVDYRVPVTPRLPDAERAEHWLMERGHEQGQSWIKFARETSPPAVADPPGIEVELIENEDWCETFIWLMDGTFGACSWLPCFCIELHRRPGWRLYIAYEEDDGESLAGVAMLMHDRIAQLGLLATEGENGGECQAALLNRCIRDAAAAGCGAVFAETEAPQPGERLSSEAENLFLAGFKQAFVRPDWRPSRSQVEETLKDRTWLVN